MMLTLFLPTMCTLSPKSMRGGPGFGGWLGGCGYCLLDVCIVVDAVVCCVYGGGGVCS